MLGAAGPVGRLVMAEGLRRGFAMTALVRRPEAAPDWPPPVRVVQGDVLDAAAVDRAIAGQHTVIYAIGTKSPGATTLFSDSTRLVIEAMRRHGAKRLVCITGVGAGDTRGHGGFLYDRIVFPLFTRRVYDDKNRQEALIRASDREWVLVRPAPFKEPPLQEPLQVLTHVGDRTLRRVSREEVARFVVDQVTSDEHLRTAVFIGHP